MKLRKEEVEKIQASVLKSMMDYKKKNGIMGLLESKLTEEEIKEVLNYFSQLRSWENIMFKLGCLVDEEDK